MPPAIVPTSLWGLHEACALSAGYLSDLSLEEQM